MVVGRMQPAAVARGGVVTDEELRAALEARLGDCWERLEDAVSELHAVHDVGLTAIVERISALVAREHGT
jgi:hypothetical protein